MSRLRLIFVLSLIILSAVFVSTIYFIPSGQDDIASKRARIIAAEEQWILQYDIINNKDRDIKYTIHVTIDDVAYRDSAVVKPGKTYTYIRQISPQELVEGKVTFTLYEEGKSEPVEEVTYHIDRN